MKPPEKLSPGGHRGEAEQTEAHDTPFDNTTNVFKFSRAGWKSAMRRAYAIRRYQGRAKDHAVHLWRVAVVDAIGPEARA